jgi:uncharacterized protein (DUF1330 family)
MYQDYKDLLSAFHAHGVRYLIVGGYAVIFHAQQRFTRDIVILRWCKEKSERRVGRFDRLCFCQTITYFIV